MPDVATVGTTIATSAIVSAAVQLVAKYFFDRRLERDKADLNRNLETWRTSLQQETNAITAEQTRVTNRLQATFSALQTERAAAIKELYARIVRVETVLNELAIMKTISDDIVLRYHDDVNAFVEYFLPNRIWLPFIVATQIGELRSIFGSLEKTLQPAPRNVPLSREFRRGLMVIKGATAQALEDVSTSFRDLLGAETRT